MLDASLYHGLVAVCWAFPRKRSSQSLQGPGPPAPAVLGGAGHSHTVRGCSRGAQPAAQRASTPRPLRGPRRGGSPHSGTSGQSPREPTPKGTRRPLARWVCRAPADTEQRMQIKRERFQAAAPALLSRGRPPRLKRQRSVRDARRGRSVAADLGQHIRKRLHPERRVPGRAGAGVRQPHRGASSVGCGRRRQDIRLSAGGARGFPGCVLVLFL